MKTLLITGILALALCTGTICADPINIALGKPVTLNGVFPIFENICDGPPPQASAATITDGVFLPNNTCWQLGTVYWSPEFSSGNSIEIDLQGTFQLDAAIVQADDNDAYQLQYRDPQGVYHDWWTVPQTCCFGMLTRPNQFDNTEPQSLPTVTATGLRIFGIDNQSDLLFSVSEVQVFGNETGPCTLNLAASVTEGTLTLEVQLGTQAPATWNVWLVAQTEVTPVVSAALPVIEPPAEIELDLPFFPALGTVGFLTTLTTPVQGIICSAFVTVDTGASELAAASSPQVLQDLLAPAVNGLHGQLRQQHIR